MKKLRLLKGLSVALFAWAIFVIPANAITIVNLNDGDSVNLLDADVFLFDPTISVDGPASFSFNFAVAAADAPQPALAAELTLTGFGAASGPSLIWSDSTGDLSTAVFTTTATGFEGSALTNFVSGTNLNQTLTLAFASITAPIGISLQVAAVPLPPALLLFGTSILGLGFLSRRRRKKAGAKMIAA